MKPNYCISKGLEALCFLLISQGFLNEFISRMLYKDRKLYFSKRSKNILTLSVFTKEQS